MPKKMALAFLFVFTMCITCWAQPGKNSQPSPRAQAQCDFSGEKSITVAYPSGHKNLDGMGANEGTIFVTNENLVTVKATDIPPGEYTFSVVRNSDGWTLILNKLTGDSTIPRKYESKELARLPMSVTKLPSSPRDFTISFVHTGGSCTMRMNWDNTQASVEFAAKNTDLPIED